MSSGPTALDVATVGLLLDRELRNNPDRAFCSVGSDPVTIRDLCDGVNRTANALFALGMHPGDRVATLLGNGLPIIQVMLAALRTGLVWVPLNVNLRGASLSHGLADSAPTVLVLDPTLVPADDLPANLDGCTTVVSVPDGSRADSFEALVAAAPPADPVHRAGPDDTILISYTSGTTGPAKGVLVTNRMFRAAADAIQRTVEPQPGDCFFLWEPLYHNGGNQMIVFALHQPVTLAIAPRFSVTRFWDDVIATGATHLHYLGGILSLLMKNPMPQPEEHAIKVVWGGGCGKELWDSVESCFGSAPREVYGMTETSSIVTVNLGGPAGSVGRAVPHFEVAILDRTKGEVVEAGVQGEIVVRDDNSGLLTAGYWRKPEATAALLPGDSWLHTGDAGHMDEDGYLYFSGRLNDSVRHRGENVSSWEVESVIVTHPEIAECAMVGVDSPDGEQDIKIFVRLAEGSALEPATLAAWCEGRLARHQVPRFISYVQSLPKTPTQRVRKELLRGVGGQPWDRAAHRASSSSSDKESL